MAATYQMTWDKNRSRWFKHYRNKHYVVSCRALREMGLPVEDATKDGSRRAANLWWERKKAEIDLERLKNVRKPLPLEDLAAGLVGASPEAFSDLPSLFDSKPVLAALAGI